MYANNLNHVYAIHFVCLVIRSSSDINLMWGNFLTFTNPVASPELTAWIFSSVPSHFISGKSFSPFLPLKNKVSGSILTNAILVLNFWGYSISISIANCYSTFNCYTNNSAMKQNGGTLGHTWTIWCWPCPRIRPGEWRPWGRPLWTHPPFWKKSVTSTVAWQWGWPRNSVRKSQVGTTRKRHVCHQGVTWKVRGKN